MADTTTLRVGDPAPDFTLDSARGEPIRLSDYRGKSEVVLYFYPKANTPGCSAEACSFRDSYEAFREAGAEVIGISSDPAESHDRFARRLNLPFVLLSDPGGAVRSRYGVPKTLGVFPGRTTYLIDRQGVIRLIFTSALQFSRHVTEALDVLRSLRSQTNDD